MKGKETVVTTNTYPFGFDGEIFDYDSHPKSSEHTKKYFNLSPIADFCRLLKAKRQPTRLLDLGSGIGVESAALIDFLPNTKVTSLDISTEGSRRGKIVFGLDQTQADVDSLPFQRKSFDAIHCKDVLVHIPDKKKFLAGIAWIMKHHGLLLLVSSKKAWSEYLQFDWTPGDIIATAKCQGLELMSIDIKNLRTEDWYHKPSDRVIMMFRKQ